MHSFAFITIQHALENNLASFICYLYHIQSASHLNMEFSLNKKVLHLCLFSPTVHIITIIGYFIMIYLFMGV